MAATIAAELVARALVERGVDTIFTLSGGHITPIYQFLENGPVTLFDTRHEQAAVFMAEAYGRMRRRPGIAMVTAGPGFTNALTAVANARQSNSPLVLIAGSVGIGSCERLDLQDMRQAPVIEPMVKRAFVCHSPARAGEFVDMACRTAMAGRPGPVYLELPVDVLNAPVDDAAGRRLLTDVASCPVDAGQAESFIDRLAACERPMVIAGSGAWYADAGVELTAFAEGAGAPVFTAGMGRGVLPDGHPLCFESSIGVRPGATIFAQVGADLVLFLGNRVSLYYLFGTLIACDATLVQVDVEPEEIGRNRTVDLPICSDARGFLAACNRILAARGLAGRLPDRFAPWVGTVRAAHDGARAAEEERWSSDAVPIHPMRLAREVDAFMDRDDDIVVADGGDTQVWMGMTRTVRRAGRYLDSGLYGCLGVGLPYANAASFLNPGSRVCLIIGDGSVGFNFIEFETAIRKKLPIVVVVSNDLGWGMIRHSQELRLGRAIPAGTWIGEVPYHKAVEALGGRGVRIDRPEQIRTALEEAFASGLPTCINVMTDPTTISPGSVALANVGSAYQ